MASNHGGSKARSPAKNEGANEKIQEAIRLACGDYAADVYETFGKNSMVGAGSTSPRKLLLVQQHCGRQWAII